MMMICLLFGFLKFYQYGLQNDAYGSVAYNVFSYSTGVVQSLTRSLLFITEQFCFFRSVCLEKLSVNI